MKNDGTHDSLKEETALERRDFLNQAAFWTTCGAMVFAGIGVLRMPKPGVLPGKPAAFKIGSPGKYPMGEAPFRIAGHNLFVFHKASGFFAVSAVCTHLGCIVTQIPEGFSCPCHGSRFDLDGTVLQGPAGSPLPWYKLSQAPDGNIVVHTNKVVPAGTFIRFA